MYGVIGNTHYAVSFTGIVQIMTGKSLCNECSSYLHISTSAKSNYQLRKHDMKKVLFTLFMIFPYGMQIITFSSPMGPNI